MSTKFNSLFNRGGQILFALTLTMMMMSTFSFGQPIEETIYGESLWRNQGYGVSNHKFDIKNYIIVEMTEYPLDPDPITGACSVEFYTSDILLLHEFENQFENTLKIRPYSVNNYADYTNGISAVDLLFIAHHYNMVTLLDSYSPTDDAPYRYISADADYDGFITSDDTDMLLDLLLGYRYDLERNSWEWVHKEEVEEAEERFVEDPFIFVIDYNWEGPEGIIIPALSTDQIQANNGNYFDFRATKVGDIVANSSWANSSHNSWVCGSGSYLTGGDIQTRSVINAETKKVRSGSIITVAIDMLVNDDIFAFQLPVYFNLEDFEIVDLVFAEGYTSRWNYNKAIGGLVIMDYAKDMVALNVPMGRVVTFQLKALKDIQDIHQSIGWHDERATEIIGKEGNSLDAEVKLVIVDILPGNLFLEVRSDGDDIHQVYIESPIDQIVDLYLDSYQGQRLLDTRITLTHGENLFPIDVALVPGIYLVHAKGENGVSIAKLCIQ